MLPTTYIRIAVIGIVLCFANSASARFVERDPLGLEGGINPYVYVENNPANKIDPQGLKVSKCGRPAQILFGLVDHWWLQTDTKEAGMGPAHGVLPGDDHTADLPYLTDTKIVDHSWEQGTCKEIECIDEDCVNRELQIDKPTGKFSPWNNCHTLTESIIKKCRKTGSW